MRQFRGIEVISGDTVELPEWSDDRCPKTYENPNVCPMLQILCIAGSWTKIPGLDRAIPVYERYRFKARMAIGDSIGIR